MLNPREQKILDIINEFIDGDGITPSYKQIMQKAGLKSKSQIGRRIARLEQLGYIYREPNKKRSIVVGADSPEARIEAQASLISLLQCQLIMAKMEIKLMQAAQT